MNIIVKNDLELGQRLFRVEGKLKNVYKPCTLCNNTRTVEITEGERKWCVTCPKCAHKQIKGEEDSCISISQYSTKIFEVSEVSITRGNGDNPVKVTIRLSESGSYSRDFINLETMRDSRGNYYFLDKKDCSNKAKELNALEKQKVKNFLGDDYGE